MWAARTALLIMVKQPTPEAEAPEKDVLYHERHRRYGYRGVVVDFDR